MITQNKKKGLKIRYIFVLLIVLFAFYSYSFGFLSLKITHPIVENFIRTDVDLFANEFNFLRLYYADELKERDTIYLKLSVDDIQSIDDRMKKARERGYISDQDNLWRKGKIVVDGKVTSMAFKVHGTSAQPTHTSMTLFQRLREKIGLTSSFSHIYNAGVSLKIKFNKEDDYFEGMRRMVLINPYDEFEISTLVMNRVASDLGLVSPYGRYVLLNLNGNNIGPYYFVEDHRKEWFERNQKLTNYTVIKSIDDWTKKSRDHVSMTDLYIEDKEIKSTSNRPNDALSALSRLFHCIKKEDTFCVKNMLNLEQMSKYAAMVALTNNPHPTAGDNLRYIYDHSSGRFQFLFRLEDSILANSGTVESFNAEYFSSREEYGNSDSQLLLKLLLKDKEFLILRGKYLRWIIAHKKQIIQLANELYAENIRIFKVSGLSHNYQKYRIKIFRANLNNNLAKIDEYLNYNKVFVTLAIGSKA